MNKNFYREEVRNFLQLDVHSQGSEDGSAEENNEKGSDSDEAVNLGPSERT